MATLPSKLIKYIYGGSIVRLTVTSVELPALTQVRGAFNIQSSGTLDCSAFDQDKKSKQVIKGHYVCQGSVSKPGGQGTQPSSANPASSSKAAAANVEVNLPAIMGGTSIIAGLLQMIL